MARLTAPRPVGNSPGGRPDPAQQDKPSITLHTGWPFAKGSQNNLDETAAHWPRPVSKPAPARPEPTAE
ncbi:MAG: hypothetical protein Q8M51_06670 [Polaromonas sp.]|uniref:hypothetical protein n=1 Tax=Polaromonas sp. TaxID=1869339 RepID=UPI00272F89B9|nr:hypothetical protein [Polaromonas sp.]MDP1742628.1 hypothetical protein [Polaromonas sp.]MDP1955604.1 hypothetical protein [Polaromonas sp.]MDP3355529.1 hypothetical protein [Polaromonas sp.]MDP3752504.1 hypothetical protein [Polaromonas sp.]